MITDDPALYPMTVLFDVAPVQLDPALDPINTLSLPVRSPIPALYPITTLLFAAVGSFEEH